MANKPGRPQSISRDGERRCWHCKAWKPFSEFGKDRYRKDGIDSTCRECKNSISLKRYHENLEESRAKGLAYYYANREARLLSRKKQGLKKYGLTLEQFEKMYFDQMGLCAICNRPMTPPCVDHIAGTKIARGLLCHGCNRGIGLLGDSESVLLSAANYVGKKK